MILGEKSPMEQLTRITFWPEEDGYYYDTDVGGLIFKISKTAEDFDGEETRTVNLEIYPAKEVPVTKYRKWEADEDVELVEFDNEDAAEQLLSLTGKREELNEWIRE